MAAAKRILDVPDEAPLDEMKVALGALGIDADTAVERVRNLVAEYPRRLIEEAKQHQKADRNALEHFQQQVSGLDLPALQEQVRLLIAQLPPSSARQMQAYHRELSAKTGDDARSELVDLLWQLNKGTKRD